MAFIRGYSILFGGTVSFIRGYSGFYSGYSGFYSGYSGFWGTLTVEGELPIVRCYVNGMLG